MLVLINNNFKALRQGEFVTADTDAGEFILDTENCDLAVATLSEIASANKVSLKKEKKDSMVSNLETELTKLKLPEMNEMSNSDKVKEIVLKGFEDGLDDESMLIEIVQAGIPFRHASKEFRRCVEENGLRISGKKRNEAIEEILESDEFFPETYQEVSDMCDRISKGDEENELEAVADTSSRQAMKVIKKFLKDKEIEFPKAPRKAKGGLRARYLGFASANPASTDEELAAWYVVNTKDKDEDDIAKWTSRYSSVINHGRAVAATCIENEVAPAPVTVAESS